MKATFEFDATELKVAITTGTLMALANAVSEAKDQKQAEAIEVLKAPVQQAPVQPIQQEIEDVPFPHALVPQPPLVNYQPAPQAPVQHAVTQTPFGAVQQGFYPQTQPAQAPVPQAPPMQPVVPTAQAPSYSLDQLSVAAVSLMDAGKQQDLLALLASFGVAALTQLPKERYGEFATQLRARGAKI